MMKITDIHCTRCNQFLAQRQGNTLIYHSLRLVIPHRAEILCPACEYVARFSADQEKKTVDTRAKQVQN